MPRKTKKKPNYTQTIGRRKTSKARVRLLKGIGEITVNQQPISQYFPGVINQNAYQQPLKISHVKHPIHATIKVSGGGKHAQLQAVTHGLSRALEKYEPKLRPDLKKAGLLKRDPRTRERRKAGLAHGARARKQSPKR